MMGNKRKPSHTDEWKMFDNILEEDDDTNQHTTLEDQQYVKHQCTMSETVSNNVR